MAEDEPQYASRVKIHPQRIAGAFRRLKWLVLAAIMVLYYGLPWLRWDRGPGTPNQAILADMTGRRLFFFEIEIWPQEIYYLTGLLIAGAVALFLITALAGRVWCGFTCPQTIWTDLFMLVERWVEGDRNKRLKLDQAPFSLNKLWRRTAKHSIWLLIALVTGGAWIMYFVDAPTVTVDFFTGQASSTIYGFTALFTATTYVLAGLAREQVCTYMCPWPRFQGAMFDEHSLIITYEAWRGEPRGKAREKVKDQLGDCVDCSLCVNVCPTGIDIRDGQQMQCIGCALCIDACNSIMKKLDRPPNLIAYDSIANMNARAEGQPTSTRLLRPRIIAYSVSLLLILGLMTYGLSARSNLEINLQRDRSPLFVTLSDGNIRNGYTLKILNMERRDRVFRLSIEKLPETFISVIGYEKEGAPAVDLPVKADSVGTFRVFVRVPPDRLNAASTDMEFMLRDLENGDVADQHTFFYGPKQ
ncbi:MAG: cytochrome c oxidase accessory protein CcoG [Rhodospirillales bacterium]|nr:cytochrome c oxidase accessory protein CcoG [Rhodospirillales bacterium]